jgi:hypothetical protein
MNLPGGDSAQNARNRQIEKADRENVKRARQNDISGTIRLRSPDGTWWTLAVDNSGNVSTGGAGGASSASYVNVSNTDTSTDINTSNWTDIPFSGTTDHVDGDDYTIASTSITVKFDGVVSVTANVTQTGSTARTNVGIRITKNNNKVSGIGQSGYIRAASNHDTSSSHIYTRFNVEVNDVIRVQGLTRGAAGAVTQLRGQTSVIIERRA